MNKGTLSVAFITIGGIFSISLFLAEVIQEQETTKKIVTNVSCDIPTESPKP
jgi:hypothetical protein